MSKKLTKETRGRKAKMHKPLNASFNQVLEVIAKSDKDTRAIRAKKKK